MTGTGRKMRGLRKWLIGPTLAFLTTAVVPLAVASGAGGDAGRPELRAASAEDPMVAETSKLIDDFLQRWKENRLDELVAAFYSDDAVMVPPNHEPIVGRPAILAFLKRLRDVVGDFDPGDHVIRVTPGGGHTVSWVGQYTFHGGTLRVTTHELYVRQPDGSVRCAVDMFGSRDPLR